MVEPIPGFTADETELLREAQRANRLSEDQKRLILERSQAVEEDRPPRTLEELTGGLVTRAGATAVGGMTGSAAGSGLGALGSAAGGMPGLVSAPGRVAAGSITGGALGAAGGSLVFDTAEDALKAAGILESPMVSTEERVRTATREGVLDLTFSLGGSIVTRPLMAGRALLGKLFGLTSREAKEARALAEGQGVGLGAVDVGGRVPKLFNKAINIFPFTGTPARRAFVGKQRQAGAAAADIINELAPNATITSELGIDMAAAARATRKEFVRITARNYANFRLLAANASKKDIIPTEEARILAGEFSEEADAGRVLLENNKELTAPVANATEAFIKQLQDLPELITIQQYRRVIKDLRNVMDVMAREGFDISRAADMKKALEVDLNNIRVDLLPEGEAAKLAESLQVANRFHAKGSLFFETPTAQRLERIDKTIFETGAPRPGSLNEDEVARVALNLKSPQSIDDLEALVGPELVRRAGRKHLEGSIRQATETVEIAGETIDVINPVKLESILGITGRGKDELQGLSAIFRKAGFDSQALFDFIESAKQIEGIGDPSTFVARRVTLGGTAALGALAGLGGAQLGQVGLSGAVLMAITARFGSEIMSNPRAAKNLATAADTLISDAARRAAYARLVKFVVQQTEQQTEIERREALPRVPTGP